MEWVVTIKNETLYVPIIRKLNDNQFFFDEKKMNTVIDLRLGNVMCLCSLNKL